MCGGACKGHAETAPLAPLCGGGCQAHLRVVRSTRARPDVVRRGGKGHVAVIGVAQRGRALVLPQLACGVGHLVLCALAQAERVRVPGVLQASGAGACSVCLCTPVHFRMQLAQRLRMWGRHSTRRLKEPIVFDGPAGMLRCATDASGHNRIAAGCRRLTSKRGCTAGRFRQACSASAGQRHSTAMTTSHASMLHSGSCRLCCLSGAASHSGYIPRPIVCAACVFNRAGMYKARCKRWMACCA